MRGGFIVRGVNACVRVGKFYARTFDRSKILFATAISKTTVPPWLLLSYSLLGCQPHGTLILFKALNCHWVGGSLALRF